MESNLIYQCHTGKLESYITLSSQDFNDYADKYNVDYIINYHEILDKCYDYDIKYDTRLPLYHMKLQHLFDEQFDKWDKILYVDTDILIKDDRENIFDINIDNIGIVQDLDLSKEFGRIYYNTGVFITTKKFRQKLRSLFESVSDWMIKQENHFDKQHDEEYLTYMLTFHDINVTMLEQKWNIWYRDRKCFNEHVFYHFSNTDKLLMKDYYFENRNIK